MRRRRLRCQIGQWGVAGRVDLALGGASKLVATLRPAFRTAHTTTAGTITAREPALSHRPALDENPSPRCGNWNDGEVSPCAQLFPFALRPSYHPWAETPAPSRHVQSRTSWLCMCIIAGKLLAIARAYRLLVSDTTRSALCHRELLMVVRGLYLCRGDRLGPVSRPRPEPLAV